MILQLRLHSFLDAFKPPALPRPSVSRNSLSDTAEGQVGLGVAMSKGPALARPHKGPIDNVAPEPADPSRRSWLRLNDLDCSPQLVSNTSSSATPPAVRATLLCTKSSLRPSGPMCRREGNAIATPCRQPSRQRHPQHRRRESRLDHPEVGQHRRPQRESILHRYLPTRQVGRD